MAGLTAAHAQTLVVVNGPPGTTVELFVESATAASATIDDKGTAMFSAPPATLGTRELDAVMRVDTCATSRRLLVTTRLTTPPPPGLCTRSELTGVFLVNASSSLLLNLGGGAPTIRLWQGRPPAEWLAVRGEYVPGTEISVVAPAGLILSGAIGKGEFADFDAVHCGSAPTCTGDDTPRILSAGLAYWFAPFVGVEGTFVKPGRITAAYTEPTFDFASDAESGVFTFSAVGGIPGGRTRTYGKFGGTYHRATFTTRQTLAVTTVTIDDQVVPVSGGSQTTQVQTGGFGWTAAAGFEYWLGRPFGVYAELGQMKLKGSDRRDGEFEMKDIVTYVVVGGRLRIPMP